MSEKLLFKWRDPSPFFPIHLLVDFCEFAKQTGSGKFFFIGSKPQPVVRNSDCGGIENTKDQSFRKHSFLMFQKMLQMLPVQLEFNSFWWKHAQRENLFVNLLVLWIEKKCQTSYQQNKRLDLWRKWRLKAVWHFKRGECQKSNRNLRLLSVEIPFNVTQTSGKWQRNYWAPFWARYASVSWHIFPRYMWMELFDNGRH